MEKKPKLYIKNSRGRYEEYHEPERPAQDNALYRRQGKKYVPVQIYIDNGFSWQEGVFVVTRSHSSKPDSWTSAEYLQKIFRLYRASDIENVSIARLGSMQKLANHLFRHWNEIEGASPYEKAASIVAILMNYDEKEQNGKDLHQGYTD